MAMLVRATGNQMAVENSCCLCFEASDWYTVRIGRSYSGDYCIDHKSLTTLGSSDMSCVVETNRRLNYLSNRRCLVVPN